LKIVWHFKLPVGPNWTRWFSTEQSCPVKLLKNGQSRFWATKQFSQISVIFPKSYCAKWIIFFWGGGATLKMEHIISTSLVISYCPLLLLPYLKKEYVENWKLMCNKNLQLTFNKCLDVQLFHRLTKTEYRLKKVQLMYWKYNLCTESTTYVLKVKLTY